MDLELRHLRCLVAIVDPGGQHSPVPAGRRDLPAAARRTAIAVQMIWRRHDPHPSTHAAIAMVTELYRHPS